MSTTAISIKLNADEFNIKGKSQEIDLLEIINNDEISEGGKDVNKRNKSQFTFKLVGGGEIKDSDNKVIGKVKEKEGNKDQLVIERTDDKTDSLSGTASYGLIYSNASSTSPAELKIKFDEETPIVETAEIKERENAVNLIKNTKNDIEKSDNNLKIYTPPSWKIFSDSAKKAISEGNEEEILNKVDYLIDGVDRLKSTFTGGISTVVDKKTAQLQALMLREIMQSLQSSNLSSQVKFTCTIPVLIFCKFHGILPDEIAKDMWWGAMIDSYAKNIPYNFGYHNWQSATGAALDIAGLVGPKGVQAMTQIGAVGFDLATKPLPFIKTAIQKVFTEDELLKKAAERIGKKAAEESAEGATKGIANKTINWSEDMFDAAKSKLNKAYSADTNNTSDTTQKALKEAAKEYAAMKGLRNIRMAGATVENVGERVAKGNSGNSEFNAATVRGFVMGEDSLVSLHSKIKEDNLLSLGLDFAGAGATGFGVGMAFAWTGPLAFLIGGTAAAAKFTMDSWQKGRGGNGQHIEKINGMSNTITDNLSKFAGADYSALTGYTPSSSYVASSPPPQTQQAQKEDQTKIASGNPSPFACA